MSQSEIEQIELTIEEAEKMVERMERALRLAENPDFKALILEGYFKEEAIRLTHLLSAPALSPKMREDTIKGLEAIGLLKQHLHAVVQKGVLAEQEIKEAREEADLIRAEEDGQ